MKTRIIKLLLIYLFTCIGSSQQPPTRDFLGNDPLPIHVQGFPASPVRPSTDYQPLESGLISMVDAETLQQASAQASASLADAPNDSTGKQSLWYVPLQGWTIAAAQAATAKTQNSVFALIPTMADYFERDINAEHLALQFKDVSEQMEGCGSVVLQTIGNFIQQNGVTVDTVKLNAFVRVFATGRFYQQGEWEDEKPLIDAGGVMILDSSAVVIQLKGGNWRSAKQFLGGAEAPNEFFSRYVSAGYGLSVLKTKYTANQSAIDARFVELKTWIDEQEQAANHPPP